MVQLFKTKGRSKASQKQLNSGARGLRSAKAKKLFSFSRWLHIYISSALFGLLLFFCITGITLNHPNWGKSNVSNVYTIELPEQFASIDDGDKEYPLKKLQYFIEEKTGLSSPRSIDVMLEVGELTYDYPLPSGYAFVTVLIEDRLIEIEVASSGVIALLNDLHKGRHSGAVWAWVIDLSAGLVLFFTITGLIILFQNAKHRKKASFTLLLGLFTPVIIYLLAVPRFIY